MSAPNRRSEAGFTMIEILLSMGLVAIMMSLVWSSFSLTARSKERAEHISGRYHQIRLAVSRMNREISMAFLSKNHDQNSLVPRTMFQSERGGRISMLTFSSLSHVRLEENARESEQTLIRYYAAPDPEKRSQTNLMRRASKRLGAKRPGEEGPAYTILEDVVEVKYRFYDPVQKEWRDRWDTRNLDGQPHRLPSKVEITIVIRDENGKDKKFVTATRVYMRDSLLFLPS